MRNWTLFISTNPKQIVPHVDLFGTAVMISKVDKNKDISDKSVPKFMFKI